MKIGTRIELEVRSKDGKIIHKHEQESKSWLANFLRALRAIMYVDHDDNVETLKNTSGNEKGYPNLRYTTSAIMSVKAPEGNDSYGILVGTGTKVVEPEDFNLDNKITNGSGTGQLLYGETSVENVGISGNIITLRITRTFSNNSGSSIVIREIGLVMTTEYESGYDYFLIARDVLSEGSEVSVPDGLTLTVRYVISVTV